MNIRADADDGVEEKSETDQESSVGKDLEAPLDLSNKKSKSSSAEEVTNREPASEVIKTSTGLEKEPSSPVPSPVSQNLSTSPASSALQQHHQQRAHHAMSSSSPSILPLSSPLSMASTMPPLSIPGGVSSDLKAAGIVPSSPYGPYPFSPAMMEQFLRMKEDLKLQHEAAAKFSNPFSRFPMPGPTAFPGLHPHPPHPQFPDYVQQAPRRKVHDEAVGEIFQRLPLSSSSSAPSSSPHQPPPSSSSFWFTRRRRRISRQQEQGALCLQVLREGVSSLGEPDSAPEDPHGRTAVQVHVRNIHNKEKPFKCPLCERCFGQQTNLDRHLKKHETEGPHLADSPPSAPSSPSLQPGLVSGREDVDLAEEDGYFSQVTGFVSRPHGAAAGEKGEDADDEDDEDLDGEEGDDIAGPSRRRSRGLVEEDDEEEMTHLARRKSLDDEDDIDVDNDLDGLGTKRGNEDDKLAVEEDELEDEDELVDDADISDGDVVDEEATTLAITAAEPRDTMGPTKSTAKHDIEDVAEEADSAAQ
ncbi:hypothetical protein RRG08_066472 [Elysia crispata]|uniref:C2H2-type domain-containing protein n=1 Tax=Elysia crispata TaxID=231223 RepID=A0AAE1DHC4_9GAST|nr:hypothetical protein RRG08_066472 [Elysia crispata]